MTADKVTHGPDCWPWECVCPLQMTYEQTMEFNENKREGR